MRHILSLAAVGALAAAPAYAQTPPVQNRTEIQAPTEVQNAGRAVAGQNAAQPAAGQVGNRPIAGRSVPANEVGQVGQVVGQAGAGREQLRTGIGRLPATAVAPSVNDALFAAAAADSGMAELILSRLGAEHATDPELKRFSEQMIQEHSRMNNELTSLAAQKGIRIPDVVDVRSQFCAQSLAGLSGEKFDHCYARAQLVAHMEAVALFEAEAERGADPNVKALAGKALTHIKAHLEEIKPIARKYMHAKESSTAEHGRIGQPIR